MSEPRVNSRYPVPAATKAQVESNAQLDIVLKRTEWVYRIFADGSNEYHSHIHRNYDRFMDTNVIRNTGERRPLPVGDYELPETIHFEGSRAHEVLGGDFELTEFIYQVNVLGLAVVHEGRLVSESYFGEQTEQTRWMTNSASKLIVSMLFQIALDEGTISSIDQPLTDYWPELAETEWSGTSIADCIAMKSGMAWNEENLDLFQDCPWNNFLHGVAFGDLEDHLLGMARNHPPGEFLNYSSLDTELLGGILVRATGIGIAEYLETRVWTPAGMDHDAYWVTDTKGREMALSGLCATLRDYARLGWILADGGSIDGRRILSRAFTDRLSNPDDEVFAVPGADAWVLVPWHQSFISSDPTESEGDFMACGSYGQIIYANPGKRTAIAVQSCYPDIANEYPDMYRQFIACRQIASELNS